MTTTLKIDHQITQALSRIEADQVKAASNRGTDQVPSPQAVADALKAKLIEVGDYLRAQGVLR